MIGLKLWRGSIAIIRDLERRGTPEFELLDNVLDSYAQLIRFRSEGRWREFADGVEHFLNEAIDASTSSAKRWATNNAKNPKQLKKMFKDADDLAIFAKGQVGHNRSGGPTATEQSAKILKNFSSMTQLGTAVFAQSPEITRTIMKANGLVQGKRMAPLIEGIRRDVQKHIRDGGSAGELLDQVVPLTEDTMSFISRNHDVQPVGQGIGQYSRPNFFR